MKLLHRAATLHRLPILQIWQRWQRRSYLLGNQTGEGWFLTGEMMELIHGGVPNIVCIQPFACLPNHIVGKGVIKATPQGTSGSKHRCDRL